MYSLGCLLYVLVNKQFAYDENHKFYNMQFFHRNKAAYWKKYAMKESKNPAAITQDFINLIDSMLAYDPAKRPELS